MKLRFMLRGAGVGLTTLAVVTPMSALALGVGQYSLQSYLNEPLRIEVPLTDVDDLSEEQLRVQLASEQDFGRLGIERHALHGDLRFDVSLDEDQGHVVIRTIQPVREPFLSFLVEYRWPSGRIVREYTVLLDPPSYAASLRPAAPAAAPATASRPTPTPPRTPVATDPAPAGSARPATAASAPSAATAGQYRVQSGDTLWQIAARQRPAGNVSVQQMMVVIQELNPGAFIQGNLNLVREGAVLQLPTEDQVRARTPREAMAVVAEQDRQWRSMLQQKGIAAPSRAPLEATPRSGAQEPASPAPNQGRVTLVAAAEAGDAGGAEAVTAAGADPAALQNELAIRAEGLDRLRRENEELRDRLSDLDDQVDTAQQLLTLRNQQIARLQEELRQIQAARGADVDPALLAPIEGRVERDDGQSPSSIGGSAEAVEPTEGEGALVSPLEPGAPVSLADGQDVAQLDLSEDQDDADLGSAEADIAENDDGDAAAVVAPAPAEPASRPVPPPLEPVPPAPGLFATLMQNPLVPVAGGGILVLLLGWGLLASRRRRAAREEAEADAMLAAMPATPAAEPAPAPMPAAVPVVAPAAAVAVATVAASDVLDEVDALAAEGRHQDAMSRLRTAILSEPARLDLKKRLFDLLAAQDDAAGFEQEATRYEGLNGELDTHIATLRPQLAGELFGDEAVADLDLLSQSTPVSEAAALEDDFSLDFDLDLSGGSDAAVEEGPAEAEEEFQFLLDDAGTDTDSDHQDLTFTLDDIELPGQASAAAEPAAEEDGLDFSLELDGLTDDGLLPAAETTVDEAGELSLQELSLDDDLLTTGPAEAGSALLDEDEDEAPLLSPEQADGEGFDPVLDAPVELPDSDFELDLGDAGASESVADVPEAILPLAGEGGELGDEDDFDFLGETDENATRLDLARAYIDMGDMDGARDILDEVIREGSSEQQAEARSLMQQVG